MSAINAFIHSVAATVTGHGDSSKHGTPTSPHTPVSTQAQSAQSASHSATMHTTTCDDVNVKSVISTDTQSKIKMENQNKIASLMSKLGSTHSQIDEYSKRRTEEISDAVRQSITKIVTETQAEQTVLLQDANIRSVEIEQEYKLKLQNYLEKLDDEKAQLLAQLEKELNLRQDRILDDARKRIDDLNEQANRLKMNVLKEAQIAGNAKIEQITDQVAALAADDASRRMQSTTTTVVTTQAKSVGGHSSHIEISEHKRH
ncbi:unnamed protein product [Didymodactylos carnosus]|uniref:Uncharacterized protein n=1 Tax=Didymodactylos carnosus TaxID=1234261 RepID=A0A813T2M6_9BILA|nr:unnamed protein product [Didymodactylos carnosus]CAF1312086.1 unnamed protein product [Didymodactylos carnosus]CAF3594258.1 unnamed protein product [Didymodactylos carnosus]CAF4120393.1 unnamed protein product [Didymodactylos carnosus]